MSNNFRLVGNIYCSKAGASSNDGLTPDTPKLTLSDVSQGFGVNDRLIIGSGTWEEGVPYTEIVQKQVFGDGLVVLKGNGSNVFASNTSTFTDLIIQDYNQIKALNPTIFTRCRIRNNPFVGTNGSGATNYSKCTFVNVNFIAGGNFELYFDQCIFINCTTDAIIAQMTSCYVSASSTIKMAIGISPNYFDYNNIEGMIYMSDGSMPNVGLSLSQFKAPGAYPNYNVHSIDLPPLFNNATKEDFSLQVSSPNISAGMAGVNIGGTEYRTSVTTQSNEFQTAYGAIISNLVLQGQDYVIDTSASVTSGFITSTAIFLSSTPQALNPIQYIGLTLFNKSIAGGQPTNTNVPDAQVFPKNAVSGGGNPDRLVIEIRTSTGNTPPTTDAGWDNNGYAPAGNWLKVPIYEMPLVDTNQIPNGEPDFNALRGQRIIGTYLQARVTLTNTYSDIS